jgi:hypothetical protein
MVSYYPGSIPAFEFAVITSWTCQMYHRGVLCAHIDGLSTRALDSIALDNLHYIRVPILFMVAQYRSSNRIVLDDAVRHRGSGPSASCRTNLKRIILK